MNCRFCGSALPTGALFCAECGRPVAPAVPELEFSSPGSAGPPGDPRPDPATRSCPQCGAAVASDEVFCGECGFVVRSAQPAPGPIAREVTGDPDSEPADPDSGVTVSPEDPGVGEDAAAAGPNRSVVAAIAVDDPTPPTRAISARPLPDPFPWGARTDVDLEATRLVTGGEVPARFVLQFSTGESVTVAGTGLVGRNPVAQPGEYVDQLVPIFDAGKSVSKTHLEFGQESGRFWISDRFSTNGSVVRQPDVPPRRCEPRRRYFVARGTRVDIGEQFFVVS